MDKSEKELLADMMADEVKFLRYELTIDEITVINRVLNRVKARIDNRED